MRYKNYHLDKFQVDSIDSIDNGDSILICAPTGSGKTLIAEYCIEKAIKEGSRIIYTAPIKALNNQKFRDFRSVYSDKVGIKTGDVTINPDAQILLMTTEIFRNTIFESGRSLDDVSHIILDEIHYLDDIERGTVWEECIIFAPLHLKFVCLSATVSNHDELKKWFDKVRSPDVLKVIMEDKRQVPLDFYVVTRHEGVIKVKDKILKNKSRYNVRYNLYRLISHLKKYDKFPALYFCFSRKDCESIAKRVNNKLIDDERSGQLLNKFNELCDKFQIRDSSLKEEIYSLLKFGVCYHHAGLLPTMKEVIEQLFSTGLIKFLVVTETFAVGVNMPARTVVFNTVERYNGKKLVMLTPREFFQMSGRAGRRGMDERGYVYCIMHKEMKEKFCRRVLFRDMNPIRSQFNLSYATILKLYQTLGDNIITACENSLANFISDNTSGLDWKVKQLRSKLSVLNELEYINSKKLTKKGHTAGLIYGYELQVVEILDKLDLAQYNSEQLCSIFLAICYEAKKSTYNKKPGKNWFYKVAKRTTKIVDNIIRIEEENNVKELTKPLDFSLSLAIISWIKYHDLVKLQDITTSDPGDIVRYFRLTIQLLRNTYFAIERSRLKQKLIECVDLINQKEVDAESQLITSSELTTTNI